MRWLRSPRSQGECCQRGPSWTAGRTWWRRISNRNWRKVSLNYEVSLTNESRSNFVEKKKVKKSNFDHNNVCLSCHNAPFFSLDTKIKFLLLPNTLGHFWSNFYINYFPTCWYKCLPNGFVDSLSCRGSTTGIQPNGRGIVVSSCYPNLVVGSHLFLVYTALLSLVNVTNQCHLLIFLLAFCLYYLTGNDDWCFNDQPKNATISDCARQKKSRDHF